MPARRSASADVVSSPLPCSSLSTAAPSRTPTTPPASARRLCTGADGVREAPEAALGADDGAALEQPQIEPLEVERRPRLRVGGGEHLEAVVEQEPVDDVRPTRPPIACERSRTSGSRPAAVNARAQARPAIPAPTTMTSCSAFTLARVPRRRSVGEGAGEARVDVGLAEHEAGGLELRRRDALAARGASPRPSARTRP